MLLDFLDRHPCPRHGDMPNVMVVAIPEGERIFAGNGDDGFSKSLD